MATTKGKTRKKTTPKKKAAAPKPSRAKKPAAKKPAAKKAVAKKPAAKKSTAKKPAAKKSTAKKRAVKKPAAKKSAAKKPVAKKTAAQRRRPAGRALKLHRTIYPNRAVQETAAAFSELAEITVERQGDYYQVQLIPAADVPPDQLVNEFANFALSRAARNR